MIYQLRALVSPSVACSSLLGWSRSFSESNHRRRHLARGLHVSHDAGEQSSLLGLWVFLSILEIFPLSRL